MAKHSGLSESTIGRIWRRFDLEPHVVDGFKLSTDPMFVEVRPRVLFGWDTDLRTATRWSFADVTTA